MNRDQLMREIKSEQKKLKIERNQMRILGDKISRIKKEIAKYKGYIKSTKNSSTIANYQRVIYEKDAQVLTCEKDINRRNNAIYKIETKIEDLRNKMLEEDNKAKIALQQKVDELSISNQQLQKELQLQKEQKERAMKEKAKIIQIRY